MRRRKHILGFAVLLAAAVSLPALAQQPATTGYPQCNKTVTKDDSELAHQKYIAGKQDYDEANYTSALRRFRDAYNLDCTKHDLLIIISATYEKSGDKKEALNALETYVARNPSAPDIATYQNKIDNMKKQLAATPPPTASTSTPTTPAEQEHTLYPWIAVGVGVAALGVGIAIIATAPKLPDACDADTKTCTPKGNDATGKPIETIPAFEERQKQAGNSVDQPTYGTIVAVIGGVLIAGGLAWHFLEPTGPKEAWQKKIRPVVGPSYGGLALGGTF